MIHCPSCGIVPVPEAELPILLPEDANLLEGGRSPLPELASFAQTTCPKCGGDHARRETDTMDTFMCSSYYMFRYVDPKNTEEIWEREKADAWLPVDIYIGGVEHACMHLLYFRFLTKVLFDAGLLPCDEPVTRLFNHGMVLDENGDVMSKSKGNAVSPGALMAEWGVDVCRVAMFFFASEDTLKVGIQRHIRVLAKEIQGPLDKRPDLRITENGGGPRSHLLAQIK